MICPHCGEETADNMLQCQHCGKPLTSGVNWGVRHSSNTYKPQYSSETEKLTSFVVASPALHKSKPQGLKIAAGIAAVALVLAVGFAGYTAAQNASKNAPDPTKITAERTEARLHDVFLGITAPGLDENGTLIPVQLTGADASGTAVDETAFIKADGTGLRLPAGNYGVQILASPITADGNIFLFPSGNKWFSIDSELEENATVDASSNVSFVFEPADPSDLNTSVVDNARSYAIEAGMSEAAADALLEPLKDAVAKGNNAGMLGSAQVYRGISFVGDVRTNTGFVPVSGVPDVQAVITRTDAFRFANNTLYYVDNALNNTTQVALHSRNMSTGQESILATDVAGQSTPYYTNGQIVYTAAGWSPTIKRIDLASGETFSVSETLPWGFNKLVGVQENAVIAATADGNLPQICIAPLTEGEQQTVTLGERSGTVVGIFDEHVLVATPDWSESKIAAYGLDGTLQWESVIEGNTQLGKQMVYAENTLAALSSGGTAIVRIDMNTGANKVYDSNVAYLFEVMYLTSGHIYFAGSNSYGSYDSYGTAVANYTTYDIDTSTGNISDLGSYEAPQDEELAQQQENMYWNWSDNSTGWDYSYYDTTANTGYDSTTTDTTSGGAADGTSGGATDGTEPTYGLDPSVGDWDANGAYVGNGQGGYDANGNPV